MEIELIIINVRESYILAIDDGIVYTANSGADGRWYAFEYGDIVSISNGDTKEVCIENLKNWIRQYRR